MILPTLSSVKFKSVTNLMLKAILFEKIKIASRLFQKPATISMFTCMILLVILKCMTYKNLSIMHVLPISGTTIQYSI